MCVYVCIFVYVWCGVCVRVYVGYGVVIVPPLCAAWLGGSSVQLLCVTLGLAVGPSAAMDLATVFAVAVPETTANAPLQISIWTPPPRNVQ